MTPTAASFACTVVGRDGADDLEFVVRDGRTLLDAIPRRLDAPIQVGCRGGGCGVCRVRVLDGEYVTKRMSRRFVTEEDEADGFALACRLFPSSDLTVSWEPIQPRRRHEVGDRPIRRSTGDGRSGRAGEPGSG
jgi:ferredoxin